MNQFLERYKELGEEFDPEKIKIKPALRVNTLKCTFFELNKRKKAKLTKIDFLDNGYYFESELPMGSTPEYLQGYYYLQEAASQTCAEALDPKPTDTVLDMCAAPGSKTTHIAMLMKNKGAIIALDANNPRLPSLRNNLERCNCSNALLYKKDARFADDIGMKFDKILLDAPCSGNFAVDPDWFGNRKIEDLKMMAKAQKQMIGVALDILNPGGTLIYSTCSLEPEENEMVIDWMLENYSDVKLEKIEASVGDSGLTNVFGKELNPEVNKCKRLWPHKTGTQGFFICKIKLKN